MRRFLLILAMLAAWLAVPSSASAADCTYSGAAGGTWHLAGNWSCNEIPDSGDNVTITSSEVSVSAPATAGTLTLNGPFLGIITFSNDVTLAVAGAMSAENGTLRGAGLVTVAGTFTKTTGGQLAVTNDGAGPSADLTLNGAASISGGSMCIADNSDAHPDLPMLTINNTFTVADGAAADPLPCTAGPRIHINAPGGHLVKTAAGTTSFGAGIDNDGTLTVQAGTLVLGGGTSGATSDGAFVANTGTILWFTNANAIGPAGQVGGPGTVRVQALDLVLADGATLDPGVLDFAGIGVLRLNGTAPITLPVVTMNGAGFSPIFDTDRPVTATSLTVNGAATLNGTSSFTVPTGGSFTKTGAGQLSVTNSGASGSADLILNVDAMLEGGSIAVAHDGSSPLDLPNLEINKQFTVGAGANTNAFPASGTRVDVNGPDGHLLKEGAGTMSSDGLINVDGGTVTVGSGQTFAITNGIAIASGVLRGSGQVTGNVTNTAGTVRPGTSPGTLTIAGNYTQGAGGTLQAEIAGTAQGTQYDHLAVTGSATLDGTLAIVNDPGFAPTAANTFDVLTTGGTVSGTFATLTGAQVPSGTYFDQYTAGPPGKVTLALTPAPVNGTPPSISGNPQPGSTLSCDPGTWSGSPTFTFQWLRDGVAIPGASSSTYPVTAIDVGHTIVCRVTATDSGGSTSADSNGVLVTALPSPPAPPPPPPPPPAPPVAAATVRGEEAFVRGTANDLYLACTKRDLLLIDVLPSGARKVSVTGSADLRLVGKTTEILLGRKVVGRALIKPGGSYAAKVAAPPFLSRANARYQARVREAGVGDTTSQQLKLERRMVATTLTRSGNTLVLRGQVTKPFARKPAVVEIQRFLTCRRTEKVKVARVVPDRKGKFTVRIPMPAGAKAAIYRALTKVARRSGGAPSARTFTLPRAIDLP